MKYLIFLLATFLITANSLLAQNQQSQNKILEIEYLDYKASEISITNAKNLVEIKEAKLVMNSEKEMDLTETTVYHLKNGNIIYKQYAEPNNSIKMTSNFFYNTNNELLEKRINTAKNGDKVEFTFEYDSEKRLIKINKSDKKTLISNVTYFEYDDINNVINKYKLGYEDLKEITWSYKTNKDRNIISKTNKAALYFGNNKHLIYSYVSKNISGVSRIKNQNDVLTGNEASNNYNYNKKGLVTNVRGDLSDGQFRFENNYIYEYEYDKYGNWFVKYEFLIPYDKEELKEQDYKLILSVIIRKISYKIGDKIEETYVDIKTVQNYLKKEATNMQIKN